MAFRQANRRDFGGGDLQDEVYAAKFLADTGYVKPKKIGITGTSYGGYMTLMTIGKTPDLWAAGVERSAIISWFSMLEHQDRRLQALQKSEMGDPVQNRKLYEDMSPITYIRQAKAPLLMPHGDNDTNVPKEEAAQVVDILKRAGNVVAAHYYPDEGHGFAKRENQIDAIRRTIEWSDRYLKGSPGEEGGRK
jgi:dipeptidyl aminopeptidase/acylaminoacyl peptidase